MARRDDPTARRRRCPGGDGIDAGLTPWLAHGNLPVAIDLFAEAGLSAAQVLTAATSGAARVCGRGDGKGRLRAGFDADVVLVDADPVRDVSAAVRRVVVVYAGGVRLDPAAGLAAPP